MIHPVAINKLNAVNRVKAIHQNRLGWGGMNETGELRPKPERASYFHKLAASDFNWLWRRKPVLKPNLIDEIFHQVMRTDTERPAFYVLEIGSSIDLFNMVTNGNISYVDWLGDKRDKKRLRHLMAQLATDLPKRVQEAHGISLAITELNYENRTRSMDFHQDKYECPPAVVILGYEPSPLKSTLKFKDCLQQMEDQAYDDEVPEETYEIQLRDLDPNHFRIVIILDAPAQYRPAIQDYSFKGLIHGADTEEAQKRDAYRVINRLALENPKSRWPGWIQRLQLQRFIQKPQKYSF